MNKLISSFPRPLLMNETNPGPQAGANHSAAIGSTTNPVFRPPRGKRKPPTSSPAHSANANGMLLWRSKRRAKPIKQAIRAHHALRPGLHPAAAMRHGSDLEKKIETEPPCIGNCKHFINQGCPGRLSTGPIRESQDCF